MKKTAVPLLVLLLSVFLLADQNDSPQENPLVLNHVIVIDRTGAAARSDMKVGFFGYRITKIGNAKTCDRQATANSVISVTTLSGWSSDRK